MNTTAATATAADATGRPGRRHLTSATAYRVFTTVVVAESAIGGTTDLLRLPPFYPLLLTLGYPGYLATILGVAKLSAAVVLAAPRLPRLKEWAYAGILINMIGAAASQVAAHQPAASLLAPGMFATLSLLSWRLRPPARRL